MNKQSLFMSTLVLPDKTILLKCNHGPINDPLNYGASQYTVLLSPPDEMGYRFIFADADWAIPFPVQFDIDVRVKVIAVQHREPVLVQLPDGTQHEVGYLIDLKVF